MIKTLGRLGIEGIYHNIYDKPTVNIILNGGELKVFPLRSGMRQECLLSPLLLNIVLEVLARGMRQDKEIKCIQIRNDLLFVDNMIQYIENSKVSTKKLWN